jgi:S-sulfo-L-cysteine synthase (3-phospho-L-serine-dependent)
MIYSDVLSAIGHTPLLRLSSTPDSGPEVFAKLELQNFFGMKDRVAKQVIGHAKSTGELRDGAPIIESSSGTMALGLALVGRALGHPVHIVTDPRIDAMTLTKLTALGAKVHIVDQMTGQGWQSARLERLAALRADLPGSFWPQQYSNPQNPLAYQALAKELVADLGHVDMLVAAVGSGGSLCGTAAALRTFSPGLWTVGVDAVGSVLFGQPDRPQRLQSGLGNSLLPANLDHAQVNEVHWLNDREAFEGTLRLARDEGIFAGNTSGSVYLVLRYLQAHCGPGQRIVGIFPDRGDRYFDTVYDEKYRQAKELQDAECADQPGQVTAGTAVSSWSYTITKGGKAGYGTADDFRRVQHDGQRDAGVEDRRDAGTSASVPH